jgi:hypothetical protein
VSVGANVFDRLATKNGARRGSGALETLNSPRTVSAATSTSRVTSQPDDVTPGDGRRTDVKRGALTKIKDLVTVAPFLSGCGLA